MHTLVAIPNFPCDNLCCMERQAHLVYDTQMTWSISVRTTSRNLFVMMELPSAKPKRE